MEQNKEYYAFISYKREDEKWAKWLQDKLEHYKFPTNLNGRTDLPKNIRPTFRDVTDLEPGLLAEGINNALTNSEWLIVVCSPRAAKSPWVCKEAQTFIDLGRADHIIPFVIEGNPFSNDTATECYPDALLNLTGSKELLAANTNEMGRDAAAIKVVARMFNLRFDTLWQRHEREQRRKRWIWIGGSLFLALLGLGIGGYFVKQNRTIERQNVQLEEERNNVMKANVSLNISLIKTYLSQGRPEMALVILNDVEKSIGLFDSVQINDIKNIKESLCDSILTSNVLLVDVSESSEKGAFDLCNLIINNKNVEFQRQEGAEVLYIHSKDNNTTDTILGEPDLNLIANRSLSYIATYVDGEVEKSDFDVSYTPNKAGIRIYSLESGRVERFVSCWGWYPWTTYPLGLSSSGKSLIYHEGYRAFEGTWYVNFSTGQRIALHTSYTNFSEPVKSSFSPNDKYFHLYFPERSEIVVYSAQSSKAIHVFRYEDCDSVFWNNSNNICISSRGKVYSWKFLDNNKNCTFKVGSFATGVNICSRYAAVACDNGKTYVWDFLLGKMIFEKEILDAPEDVAFTKDGKRLWVISGYNCIKTIDLESEVVKSVYVEDSEVGPPHPWNAYLHMTADGNYCISRCYYGDQYALFDKYGNIVKTGTGFDNYIKKHPNDILTEFDLPEEFDFDPELSDTRNPVLTARRISIDGEMCIEGYSNGIIKIASLKEKELIKSLIGNNTKDLK